MNYEKYFSCSLQNKYEFYSYGHAIEILYNAFPEEWNELQKCLSRIVLSLDDIKIAGGNKSPIPKKFDDILFPLGWQEIRISGDLIVKKHLRNQDKRKGQFSTEPFDCVTIKGFIDGHNIDYIKNKVAFDLEWNSKDQTFDRDLLAMRTYFESGLIDVGVIVTRSRELDEIFESIKLEDGKTLKKKYGASTTWMGKLLPRLDSRRNGGCPILAIGMKKGCVEGYE